MGRRMRKHLLAAFLIACGSATTPPPAQPDPEPPPEPAPQPPAQQQAPVPPPEPPPPPPAPAAPKPTMSVAKDAGLATPESVLYDATDDVYLVSNINGG